MIIISNLEPAEEGTILFIKVTKIILDFLVILVKKGFLSKRLVVEGFLSKGLVIEKTIVVLVIKKNIILLI